MRNLNILFLLTLIFIGGNVLAQKDSDKSNKKVVFIIVDGIAEDMLDSVQTPNLDRIKKEGIMLKAHVGGDQNSYNESPTISAVGYNSLLTGTWVNKHNVSDNYNQNPNYNYPTIFKLFKDQYPDRKVGIFSTWEDNRTVLIGEGLKATNNIKMDYAYDGLEKDTLQFPEDNEGNKYKMIDYLVAEKAANRIIKKAPDLSWVYLQHSDDVGHLHGDSPILYKNITYEDELVGKIYDAVKERETQTDEDWLFIVTTDHGRDSTGHGHGGQSDRERDIWIFMNKPKVNTYAANNRVGIVDLAPTIFNYLNVDAPTDVQKEIDGVDLIDSVSAYDLKASLSNNNKDLQVNWKTTAAAKGEAKIYITDTNNFKTGEEDSYHLIGRTKLKKGNFNEEVNLKTSDLYKVILKTPDGYLNTWIKK